VKSFTSRVFLFIFIIIFISGSGIGFDIPLSGMRALLDEEEDDDEEEDALSPLAALLAFGKPSAAPSR
jgi:hypothetical protein